VRGIERRWALPALSRTAKQSITAAFAAAVATLAMSAGVASADTHTGYVLTVTCGSTTTTVVSPTGPAAVAQDVSSTGVYVLAVGATYAPSSFPAGKVQYCNLDDLTTGNSYTDVPFLIKGAP
jgi:hypothetical protein